MGHGYMLVIHKYDSVNDKRVEERFWEFWIVQFDKRALKVEEVTAALEGRKVDNIHSLHDPRIIRRIKKLGISHRATVLHDEGKIIWHDLGDGELRYYQKLAERYIKNLSKRRKKHYDKTATSSVGDEGSSSSVA